MPLTYLLYRCPHCGHDPMEGAKDRATCPGCGLAFSRGGEGGLIRIQDPAGEIWEVPGARLASAVEAWTAAEFEESGSGGGVFHKSRVRARQSGAESPVWFEGELIGFAEAMSSAVEGNLEIDEEGLVLRMECGQVMRWPFMDIRAVQTSSSSLQFSPVSDGLVEFRFPEDSPFRWEGILRESLRRAYRRAGLGEIVEFQPRIVVE